MPNQQLVINVSPDELEKANENLKPEDFVDTGRSEDMSVKPQMDKSQSQAAL